MPTPSECQPTQWGACPVTVQQSPVLCRFKGWYERNHVSHKMSWRGLGSTFTCWPGQQGDRNARQDQHPIALDTPPAMDCSHYLEPTKLDIHNCAKHCFQHQCSRLNSHTHFSRTGCRMFIKLSVSLGREEMDPQTCICKGKMPGREKGREGKRDSKYLNCDFCYLWRRLLSNFLISLKKKKKQAAEHILSSSDPTVSCNSSEQGEVQGVVKLSQHTHC